MEPWKGTYLENVLDRLKTLPNDVRRVCQQIADLDQAATALTNETNSLCTKELSVANARRPMSAAQHMATLQAIREKQEQLHVMHVEKTALAAQLQTYIDAYMQRITHDMRALERELGPNIELHTARSHKRHRARDFSKPACLTRNPPPRQPNPGEAIYCFCRQISHGDMIFCDDRECAIEWYHVRCVLGDQKPPKGDWYCPKCR